MVNEVTHNVQATKNYALFIANSELRHAEMSILDESEDQEPR